MVSYIDLSFLGIYFFIRKKSIYLLQMESIPYDKRSGKIWFNGKTVDWADANIHILNHGLHYASCVFEGERVYEGEIFKFEEHTKRLFYSAKRMGIVVPYTQEDINDACRKIINIQKVQNGYVRPLIWRGSEMMAISAQKNKIHVAIATWEWGSYFDPKLKVEGIKLNISNCSIIFLSSLLQKNWCHLMHLLKV